jgi:GntR family transcriptional regulator, phosphonate transport system regulatory protein
MPANASQRKRQTTNMAKSSVRTQLDNDSVGTDTTMPVWRQIEQALSREIAAGTFEPGQKIPSAQDLAERFGVNRHTVRRAIGELEKRNLVRTETGSGTYVRERPYYYPITERTRCTQTMGNFSIATRYEVLDHRVESPTPTVSEALGPNVRRVYKLTYMSYVDERPFDYSEAYFPAQRFPNLPDVFTQHRSVTRTLAQFGVRDYLRQYTAVMAKLPTPAISKTLGLAAGRPVLHVCSINVDLEGVPVQYGETYFSGDWVQLVVRTPPPSR